jgi:hypothetical protein
MPIGRLYLPVGQCRIAPVGTILGTMFVTPAGVHHEIPAGDFDVKLTAELCGLVLPVKFYDILPTKANLRTSRVGFGFIGPVPPIQLEYGLLFRYSAKSDRVPTLVYRSREFSVYHAVNTATLITLPRTVPQIEELLTAI